MKQNIYLIFIVLLASFAFANLDLIPGDTSFIEGQGAVVNTSFVLNNTGNETISVIIPSIVNFTGSSQQYVSANFDPSSFQLTANSSQTIRVQMPLSVSMYSGNYIGLIKILSSLENKTLPIELRVIPRVSAVANNVNFGQVFLNDSSSTRFDITNDGNIDLTGITFSSSGRFIVKLSPNSTSRITPGNSVSVLATVYVPFGETIDNSISAGNLMIKTDQKDFTLPDFFKLDIGSYLNLKRVRVEVAGKTQTLDESGTSIDETAAPRDPIKMSVEVENLYHELSDQEVDIDNVNAKITIMEIDNGDDIELESDDVTLDYQGNDRRNTFDFNFTVPDDADKGSYDVEIEVTGDDSEGNDYDVIWTTTLDVEKESHRLIIENLDVTPVQIKCTSQGVVSFDIVNIGQDDEDYVRYTINNTRLGINKEESRLLVQADTEDNANIYSVRIPFSSTAGPGTYPIILRVYRDFDNIMDIATKYIVVLPCDSGTVSTGTSSGTTTGTTIGAVNRSTATTPITRPATTNTSVGTRLNQTVIKQQNTTVVVKERPKPTSSNSGVIVGTPVNTKAAKFTDSNIYLFLLAVVNLTIILVIITMIGLFSRRN